MANSTTPKKPRPRRPFGNMLSKRPGNRPLKKEEDPLQLAPRSVRLQPLASLVRGYLTTPSRRPTIGPVPLRVADGDMTDRH
jgi:hypothetical protein